MAISLSAGPVSLVEMERKVTELLNEFWSHFFTGTAVTLDDGTVVTFTKAGFYFQQAEVAQGGIPQIHTVIADLANTDERQRTEGVWEVTLQCRFNTYLRVSVAGQNGDPLRAEQAARRLGSEFQQILLGGDRISLARRGISHPTIQRGPVPISTPGARTRLCVWDATLRVRAQRFAA